MVFVSTPETAARIQFSEPSMSLEHLFRAVRFQHDFSNLNRVPFRDIHLEVNMNSGKTELTKLKTKPFKFTKPFSAGVDVGLFSETIISRLGVELMVTQLFRVSCAGFL